MGVKIEVRGVGEDLYVASLEKMAALEFPGSSTSNLATFEAVVAELVGTKQHRNGPTPNPENLVSLRAVVRDAMAVGKPIPILVPWGGTKMSRRSIDVADLMALKQLKCLNERVLQHYGAGVEMRVRLEVLTEYTLYQDFVGISRYAEDLPKLSRILDAGATFVTELDYATFGTFKGQAEQNAEAIELVLSYVEDRRPDVIKRVLPDWSGTITDEHAGYYTKLYERMHPTLSAKDRVQPLLSELPILFHLEN